MQSITVPLSNPVAAGATFTAALAGAFTGAAGLAALRPPPFRQAHSGRADVA